MHRRLPEQRRYSRQQHEQHVLHRLAVHCTVGYILTDMYHRYCRPCQENNETTEATIG